MTALGYRLPDATRSYEDALRATNDDLAAMTDDELWAEAWAVKGAISATVRGATGHVWVESFYMSASTWLRVRLRHIRAEEARRRARRAS